MRLTAELRIEKAGPVDKQKRPADATHPGEFQSREEARGTLKREL
jgi:hypothetical protein